MEQNRLLDVRDLTVHFHASDGIVNAVNGVTFHIDDGETLAVVGESGSGKSVTSLAIMGLVPNPPGVIAGGSILFRGKDHTERDLLTLPESALRRVRGNDIAMVFQEPISSLSPVYTVGDQIAEAIVLHQHKTRREALRLAADMLARLGISEPRKRLRNYPHQISGGMAQRVMIAMALSCHPSLLIADEPTTALDVTIQAQLLELIAELRREIGMAVLFITHDLGVAAEVADRILVMYAGRVVEVGSARQIFHEPRMPYTIGLLRSVPRLVTGDGPLGHLDAIPGEMPNPRNLPRGCSFFPRCSHAVKGVCDIAVPELEESEPGHWVRCVRWREVAAEGETS
ncbi:MAG: ABC transporter ATP-binding protein [Candidimonas sp.]|nr:MAG: ABC transporter ATP-binding protein [Candidimonas sp.]